MKTDNEVITENFERIKALKDATICRYCEDIDFDNELSIYDFMMEHFVNGDLDDVFIGKSIEGLNEEEKNKLFTLVRPYLGLCFANGSEEFWTESLENATINDYELIAASIFNNYDFLLGLVREGGMPILNKLVSLRENEIYRNQAFIQYLRSNFLDDRILKSVLFEMIDPTSGYDIFSDAQKGILLNFPEGTVYSYDNDTVYITQPLLLGSRLFNDYNGSTGDNLISNIDYNNIDAVKSFLSSFFEQDAFNFNEGVVDLAGRFASYRDKSNLALKSKNFDIKENGDGRNIQFAWDNGEGIFGNSLETPYFNVPM